MDPSRIEQGPLCSGAAPEPRDRSGHSVWRWLFHASWGVVIFAALRVLSPERWSAVLILALVLVAQASVEWLRLRHPSVNRIFVGAFRLLVLPVEVGTVASSTWYTAGVLLSVALLPRDAALSGILILALADPVASVVGQRWGRHRLLGGSWEGTAGFAVMALGVLLVRHEPMVAVLAAPLVALAERLSGRLDDNLVTPVASGAIVWVLSVVL